jgi:hypothetical protein
MLFNLFLPDLAPGVGIGDARKFPRGPLVSWAACQNVLTERL